MREALDDLDPDVRAALELLAENLRTVATDKMPRPTRVTLRHGQVVSTRQVPVRRVGVYVPGGLAAYPSSAVMAIVPAQVAGVPEIAVCSPPGPSGLPHSGALAVCALLGVEEVYAVGGAQAVAALALGTASIPAVDMVVGPGNAYVEEAKRRLFGEVGIESLAGPTRARRRGRRLRAGRAAALGSAGPGRARPGIAVGARVARPRRARRDRPLLPPESGVVVVEADTLETALAFVNAYAPRAPPADGGRSRRGAREPSITPARSSSARTAGPPTATTSRARTTSCRRAGTAGSRRASRPRPSCARRRSSSSRPRRRRPWRPRWPRWPVPRASSTTPAPARCAPSVSADTAPATPGD